MLSERGSEVLKQYADYCRDKLKKPLAGFQFDAISRIFRGTQSKKDRFAWRLYHEIERKKLHLQFSP